jgi:hypothetical protein
MNKRLEEIARECFDVAVDNRGREDYNTDTHGLKKFAELIIAECIAAHEDDYGADIIGDVLKKHFGVEE